MEKLRFQNKKTKNCLKKAALVFTLVATTVLGGYANWKCDRPKPKPVSVETSQRSSPKAETKTKEVLVKIEKVMSATEKKKEDGRRANEVLMELAEEFPYEGLDCKLEPLKKIKEQDPESLHEELWEEMKNASTDASRNTRSEFSEEDSDLMWCRYGMSNVSLGSDAGKECSTGLTEAIELLSNDGNVDGVLAIIRYMDSLNIEWEPDIGQVAPAVGDFGSLFVTYLMIQAQARGEGWENGPGFECILRNAYALRILRESEIALVSLLSDYPQFAESALSQLPLTKHSGLLEGCVYRLFDTDNFDRASIENFYSALSLSNRNRFFLTLYNLYVNDEDQVAHAEELAKYASDPELRTAMERIAARWKWKVKSIDEPMGEEENLSEENEPGEE